jgi:hypothetical protein
MTKYSLDIQAAAVHAYHEGSDSFRDTGHVGARFINC